MPPVALFDDGRHRNLLLDDFGGGVGVQSNQHIVQEGGSALILDPGGHGLYSRAAAATSALLSPATLRYIVLSHQDPDALGALNGWLMLSDADAFISALFLRFIPHFGLDDLVAHRLRPLPDEGRWIDLEGAKLAALPAHFLPSQGGFQLYDPVSKILYTGDLGASFGAPYREVEDFDAHVRHMDVFHRRRMASRSALRAWAAMVRGLDVELLAPQHGAFFRGRALVRRFVEWCEGLECGTDLMTDVYRIPPGWTP